jgi:hypothetical protein
MTLMMANVGVPMLFVHLPALCAALIPIMGIECWVATRFFKTPWKTVRPAIIRANVISTLMGFPVMWCLMVVADLSMGGGAARGLHTTAQKVYAVTVQAPWLMPYEQDLYWMIPCAALVLLVPAYFMSVGVEGYILKRAWPTFRSADVARFVWRSHLISYGFLALMWGVALAYDLKRHARLDAVPAISVKTTVARG